MCNVELNSLVLYLVYFYEVRSNIKIWERREIRHCPVDKYG